MEVETADARATLREEGEDLVQLETQQSQSFEVAGPVPARAPITRQSMARRSARARQTISDPTMVLRPPTPLLQQVQDIFTPRLMIAMGIVTFVVVVCSLAEPTDSRLFLGDVKHKNVADQTHCFHLCMKGQGLKAEQRPVPPYCLPYRSEETARDEDQLPDPYGFKFKPYGNETSSMGDCSFKVAPPSWQPFTTIAVLVFSVALIIDGLEAEVVLFGAVIFLAAMGVLTVHEAFGGLGNKSVVALGLLFPIAAAVDETGALEIVLGKVLGNPRSLVEAMFKLMFTVAGLSACLSNTAVVAAMIPAIVSWSRRINISPSLMLMPLSFGAQLGGSCTLIGSSHCLVASEATRAWLGGPMGMFDLTILGVVLTFLITVACVGFSFLLPQKTCDGEDDEEGGAVAIAGAAYKIGLMVEADSPLIGRSVEEVGISRTPGVKSVFRCNEMPQSRPLEASEELHLTVTAEGLINVRQIRGFALLNANEVAMLGTHRRRRRVFEVTMHASAPLLSREVTAAHIRRVFGGCVLAVRRPGESELLLWRRAGSVAVQAGDVLIIEADVSFIGSAPWAQNFALVREIPKSAPPRNGTPPDAPRSIFVCAGMLTLIFLVAIKEVELWGLNPFYNKVSLVTGAGVLVMLLLATRAVTPAAAFASIKPSVLLTVASALGLGEALKKTGVANFLAERVGVVATQGGTVGVFGAVYAICVGLSMFINNSATIAIVAPMLENLSKASADPADHIPGQYLRYILVFAAGSCFTTPLGYQTNMMVMADGGYAFADFMKFGGPVQLVHAVLCILLCWACMSLGILGGS